MNPSSEAQLAGNEGYEDACDENNSAIQSTRQHLKQRNSLFRRFLSMSGSYWWGDTGSSFKTIMTSDNEKGVA